MVVSHGYAPREFCTVAKTVQTTQTYPGVLGFGLICGGKSPQPLDSSNKKAHGQTRNRPIPSQITVRYCTATMDFSLRQERRPMTPKPIWIKPRCMASFTLHIWKRKKNGSSGTPVSHHGSVTMQHSWLHLTTGAPGCTSRVQY